MGKEVIMTNLPQDKDKIREYLDQEAEGLERKTQDKTFWLCYPEEIKELEELAEYYVYSEKIYNILQNNPEDLSCNVAFSRLRDTRIGKIRRLRGDVDLRGFSGDLPHLIEINGDVDFRGYFGQMPNLIKINGDVDFEWCVLELPALQEVGGDIKFKGGGVNCPKLRR